MSSLRRLVPLIVMLLLVSFNPAYGQVNGYELTRHDITVYRDGVVLVVQHLRVNNTLAQITLPLLSRSADSIFVVDQVNAPLAFDIAGQNITIHTLGATRATLEYQMADITSKEGAVWTLKMNLRADANVTMPDQATITFLNAIPELISLIGGKPVLLLEEGSWEISYTLPVVVQSAPQPQQPAQNSPQLPFIPQESLNLSTLWIPALGIAAAVGAFLFYRMRRPPIDTDVKLRPEEEELLKFLAESGRKALESDLRKKFLIPKTSMWRMSKRLERMGYVKINRYGSQNELELLRKP